MPSREFLGARESVYRRDWMEMPWRLVEWGLERVGLTDWVGAGGGEGKGAFVVLGNVEVGW